MCILDGVLGEFVEREHERAAVVFPSEAARTLPSGLSESAEGVALCGLDDGERRPLLVALTVEAAHSESVHARAIQ